MSIIVNLENRLRKVESCAKMSIAEDRNVLKEAYQIAVENKDKELAAEYARKLRNKLLKDSDAHASFDRLGFDLSSAAKFIVSLQNVLKGGWFSYRQELRDLPEQEGFPFNIKWPKEPEDNK